jgi:hypothetical protein
MTTQLRWIILSRFEQALSDKAQAVMNEFGFSSEQQDFIWRWIKREFNVFELTRSENSEIHMNLLDEPNSQVVS